jgi:AmmeMemoRadiSam system protein A
LSPVGQIIYGAFLPHPPLMIPEVGKGEENRIKATIEGVKLIAQELKDKGPDVLVVITPHGPVFKDAVAINMLPLLEGSFKQFGAGQVKFKIPNQIDLVERIIHYQVSQGISIAVLDEDLSREYGVSPKLDHGSLVPLYFIQKAGLVIPVVHITMGMLPREELYIFGSILQKAVQDSSYQVAVLASGDLSHRLTPDAPAGFNAQGQVFDLTVKKLVGQTDVFGLMELPASLVDQAGECGFRPLIMLLGCLDGCSFEAKVLSYEGPFGVGYMTAAFLPQGQTEERMLVETLMEKRNLRINRVRQEESKPVKLARSALETYIATGRVIKAPKEIPQDIPYKAATFVSIKKHDQLRGCIGTISPVRASTWEEIIANAIAAGTEDPRFNPVTESELEELTYSVDILGEPEPIPDISYLNPQKYGVIVSQGRKTGLLLPDLEGVDTAQEQVEIAKRKAGISGGKVTLKRFSVTRYV